MTGVKGAETLAILVREAIQRTGVGVSCLPDHESLRDALEEVLEEQDATAVAIIRKAEGTGPRKVVPLQ